MNGYSVHNENGNGVSGVVDDFHQRLNVGADVLARFNFNGNSPEDLPFQKNELLKIITITPVSLQRWKKFLRKNDKLFIFDVSFREKFVSYRFSKL